VGSREQRLQHTLNQEIPLTRAMGIEVVEVTNESVRLRAPLEDNINHKSTAFGGSLYSVAVLAGWGLIYTRLQALGLHAHIVIQESRIEYLHPVKQDIEAVCQIESERTFERLIRVFDKKSKARINLDVVVAGDTGTAVRFNGNYVIHS
jgi:thioesterase domain-containing protein